MQRCICPSVSLRCTWGAARVLLGADRTTRPVLSRVTTGTCSHIPAPNHRHFSQEPSGLRSSAARIGSFPGSVMSLASNLSQSAKQAACTVASSPAYKKWMPLVFSYSMIPIACLLPAVGLGLDYLRGPSLFSKRVDRTKTNFPDPFPEIRHDSITTNGVKLHVVTSSLNTGKRPLLLFLHGFPEFWYSWRHHLEAFQGTYDVAALDMRGYNTSDKPPGVESYSPELLAEDVAGAVKALGRERCILVGHDWGGIVAFATAALHPELVEKLVAVAAPPPAAAWWNMKGKQILRSYYVFGFQAPVLGETWISHDDFATIEQLFTQPEFGSLVAKGRINRDDIERYKAALGQPGALTATINYYRAGFRLVMSQRDTPTCRTLLDAPITTPTLMLWGENDHALGPELLHNITDMVPNLQLRTLPGCSHWVQQEQPEEVTRHISAFLEEAAAPAAASPGSPPQDAPPSVPYDPAALK